MDDPAFIFINAAGDAVLGWYELNSFINNVYSYNIDICYRDITSNKTYSGMSSIMVVEQPLTEAMFKAIIMQIE